MSKPIPVTERSYAWVYCRSLTGITSSNSVGSTNVYLLRVMNFFR